MLRLGGDGGGDGDDSHGAHLAFDHLFFVLAQRDAAG